MLLLHISDIHFRKEDVNSAQDPNAHLRNELLRDAGARCKELGAPSAILVTGDLAYRAHPEEYKFAQDWLDKLCKECRADPKCIFIIPGNHDILRAIADDAAICTYHENIVGAAPLVADAMFGGLLSNDISGPLLYKSLANYNEFASRFFCDLLPPDRTLAKRDLELNDGSKLRLIGVNSTVLCSSVDKPGTQRLMVDTASHNILREPGIENVVLCHHPYSWMRHGDAFEAHLQSVARLHLFGHLHTSRISQAHHWCRIAASAAHPDRTEPGWEPGYNLIELSVASKDGERRLKVKVHVRIWQQAPDGFHPKHDRHGHDNFEQEILLEPWQPYAAAAPAASTVTAPAATGAPIKQPEVSMDSLRDIGLRFLKLTLSEKSAIAGQLGLLQDADMRLPDYERFRQVLIRAREQGYLDDIRKALEHLGK